MSYRPANPSSPPAFSVAAWFEAFVQGRDPIVSRSDARLRARVAEPAGVWIHRATSAALLAAL